MNGSLSGERAVKYPEASAGFALIAFLALVAYWPSLHGAFVIDDDRYLTENPLIASPDGLYRFWFTTETTDYYPVSNTTLWLEWRVWGMNPTGYRCTNLLLHVAVCALLWLNLRTISVAGAFLAALLYAVHPVCVATVAGISQRKELLAALFLMLSIFAYFNGQTHRKWYWLSILAFALAILSKSSVAPLPLLLLLIDWWRHGRIAKKTVVRVAPFFVVALLVIPFQHWVHLHNGDPIRHATLAERFAGAGAVEWFYLAKALAPFRLAFFYSQLNIQTDEALCWIPLLSALALTLVLLFRRSGRFSRSLLFAWLCFGVALLPVLGFAEVGYMVHSLVSDVYQHLAIMVVMACVAAGWAYCFQRAAHPGRLKFLAALAVLTLALLTWQRNRLYGDPILVFQDSLRQNPESWLSHLNLGIALDKAGRSQEAIDQFQQAIQLKPASAVGYNDLGFALLNAGQSQQAIEYFEHALQIKSDSRETRDGLGLAYYNLGNEAANSGQPQKAIQLYRQSLDFNPGYAQAHHNLGLLLGQAGENQEALVQLQQSLSLVPDSPEAHNDLGNVLLRLGQTSAAIEHYQQAVRLKPAFVEAHYNLGIVLLELQRPDEALVQFRQILSLEPENGAAYANLAKTYAALHQPSEALATAQKALDIARAKGQSDLARQIEDWTQKYRETQGAHQ